MPSRFDSGGGGSGGDKDKKRDGPSSVPSAPTDSSSRVPRRYHDDVSAGSGVGGGDDALGGGSGGAVPSGSPRIDPGPTGDGGNGQAGGGSVDTPGDVAGPTDGPSQPPTPAPGGPRLDPGPMGGGPSVGGPGDGTADTPSDVPGPAPRTGAPMPPEAPGPGRRDAGPAPPRSPGPGPGAPEPGPRDTGPDPPRAPAPEPRDSGTTAAGPAQDIAGTVEREDRDDVGIDEDVPPSIARDLREDVAGQSEFIDPWDVRVVREGGKIVAEVPEERQLEAAEEQVAAETEGVGESDVTATFESPYGGTSPSGSYPGQDLDLSDEVAVELDPGVEEQLIQQDVAGRSEEIEPEDVEVDRLSSGAVAVSLTDEAARTAKGDAFGVAQTTQRAASADAGPAYTTEDVAAIGGVGTDVGPSTTTVYHPTEAAGGGPRRLIDPDVVSDVAGERIIPQWAVEELQAGGDFVASGAESFAQSAGDFLTGDAVHGGEEGEIDDLAELAIVRGVGGIGNLARVPGSAATLTNRAYGATAETFEDPSQAQPIASSAVGYSGLAVEAEVQRFEEDPVGATAELGGEILAGSAAIRGLERTSDLARGARVRAGSRLGSAGRRASVRWDELTGERGIRGELPQFDTSVTAPVSRAVAEVRARAEGAPEVVTGPLGTGRALYHSTRADLGRRFEAARGESEIPGLFTTPDASPLRLDLGSETSGIRLGLPRLRSAGDRLAAFPGDEIRAMPQRAAGFGRRFDPDEGRWVPDTAASGYEFLTREAARGAAYVRPTGSRTTELEAIVPPGSSYARAGQVGVRIGGRQASLPFFGEFTLGGRTVPMDIYRRLDAPDAVDAAAAARGTDFDADDVIGGERLAERYASMSRRAEAREQFPVGGPTFIPSGGGGSTTASTTPTAMSSATVSMSSPTASGFDEMIYGPSSPSGSATDLAYGGPTTATGRGSSVPGSPTGTSTSPVGRPSKATPPPTTPPAILPGVNAGDPDEPTFDERIYDESWYNPIAALGEQSPLAGFDPLGNGG